MEHMELNSSLRAGRVLVWGALAFTGVMAVGCASFKQVQHFEVVSEDPLTGERTTNFYRMTITGGSSGAVEYKLRAANMSAASVDVLRGQTPFLPEADLPIEQDEQFQRAMSAYYKAMASRSEILGKQVEQAATESDAETATRHLANAVWLSSLTPADVISVGQTDSLDPLRFRKPVFYATAKNIDLEKAIGPQIDAMISQVETLARREKQRAAERKQKKKKLHDLGKQILTTANPEAGAIIDLLLTTAGGTTTEGTPSDSENNNGQTP